VVQKENVEIPNSVLLNSNGKSKTSLYLQQNYMYMAEGLDEFGISS
jgi:hypothetical protein